MHFIPNVLAILNHEISWLIKTHCSLSAAITRKSGKLTDLAGAMVMQMPPKEAEWPPWQIWGGSLTPHRHQSGHILIPEGSNGLEGSIVVYPATVIVLSTASSLADWISKAAIPSANNNESLTYHPLNVYLVKLGCNELKAEQTKQRRQAFIQLLRT
jgi:hypothetical protein